MVSYDTEGKENKTGKAVWMELLFESCACLKGYFLIAVIVPSRAVFEEKCVPSPPV